MATKKSTKPSSESSVTREAPAPRGTEVEFPSDPDFVSRPPLVSLELMARRIRQLREMFPKGIPTEDERWLRKCDVEFHL